MRFLLCVVCGLTRSGQGQFPMHESEDIDSVSAEARGRALVRLQAGASATPLLARSASEASAPDTVPQAVVANGNGNSNNKAAAAPTGGGAKGNDFYEITL